MKPQQTVPYMNRYKVVESFVSVNGEGARSGELALFIRFAHCNLDCSYCDTRWANDKSVPYALMSREEILELIKKSGVTNVTLTGGEPLIQKDFIPLIQFLTEHCDNIFEIETNGSSSIKVLKELKKAPLVTMDYKLPSSNMESHMNMENFNYLEERDSIKFVTGSTADLVRMDKIVKKYNLNKRVNIFISPVFGQINPVEIVDFMKKKKLNNIRLQTQLHKIIWHPDAVGV